MIYLFGITSGICSTSEVVMYKRCLRLVIHTYGFVTDQSQTQGSNGRITSPHHALQIFLESSLLASQSMNKKSINPNSQVAHKVQCYTTKYHRNIARWTTERIKFGSNADTNLRT